MQAVLQDYIGRYPLRKFVDWYIDWAQKLLRNYLAFSPRRIYISGQCGFHVKDEMAPMTLSGAKDCIAKDHVRRKEHSNSTQSSSFDRVNRIIKNNYQHRRGQNVIGASLDSPDFWKWQAIDYKSRAAIMDTDFMGSKISFKKSRIRSTQVESNITDQNNFFDIDSPSNNLPESTNCIILRQRNAIVTAQKNTAIKMNCSIEPHSLRKSMSLGHIDKSDDKESTYLSPDAEDKKKKCCQFSYEREEDQLRSSRHQSLPLTPQASTISYDSRCTTVGCRLSKSVSSLSHCSDTCSGKMDLLEQRQLAMACRSLNKNTTSAMGDESVEYYISASDSDIVTVGDGFFKCLLNALFEVFSP